MINIQNIRKKVTRLFKSHDVALVLSGGGARGLAHIGAIESLEAHGFHITSIAGTSIGALVGGLYAAGKLHELERILEVLTRKQILQLVDISPGLGHIATGDKLMGLLHAMIGDLAIEDLSIPFCCPASDIVSGKQVVFRTGPLKDAIRASISIPGVFKPVEDGKKMFVDGSVHNVLPLDCVIRKKHDWLVSVNVSAPDNALDTSFICNRRQPKNDFERRVWEKIPLFTANFSVNYMHLLFRVGKISIENNTQTALRLTPPDISLEMPLEEFGLFDFDKSKELIALGRQEMDTILEREKAL